MHNDETRDKGQVNSGSSQPSTDTERLVPLAGHFRPNIDGKGERGIEVSWVDTVS
jgi:hypothetical protein